MAPHLKGKISLDSSAARNSVRGLQASITTFARSFGDPLRKLGKMAVVTGLAVSAAGAKMISTMSKMGDEFDKMSKRTGITTAELSRLKHAAELSGSSLEGLEKGVRKMQRTIYDANSGLKEYQDTFRALGLSWEALDGLDVSTQMNMILKELAGVENATRRAALAQEVFGRSGTSLLPMLTEGTKGLEAMKKEADALGIVFSTEQAASAARFRDEMLRLKGAFLGIGAQGVKFDKLSDGIKGMTQSIVALQRSGAFDGIVQGLSRMVRGFIDGINRIVSGWNAMSDAERTAVKNATITAGAIFVAFKTGLFIPLARALFALATGLFGQLSVLVAAIAAAALAGKAVVDTITDYINEKDLEIEFHASIQNLEEFKRNVEAQQEALKENAPDPRTQGDEYIKMLEASGALQRSLFLEERKHLELKNRYHEALRLSEGSLGDIIKRNMETNFDAALDHASGTADMIGKKFTEAFDKVADHPFLTGLDKLFGGGIQAAIPDLADATNVAGFAGYMEDAEGSMEMINRLAAPLRGFTTGTYSINGALNSNGKSEQDAATTTKNTGKIVSILNQQNLILETAIKYAGAFSFIGG